MFIYFIYFLIFLILIFVLFLGFRAVNIGISAKKNMKINKKIKKNELTKDLKKLNQLYKEKAITKKEFKEAKNKLLRD